MDTVRYFDLDGVNHVFGAACCEYGGGIQCRRCGKGTMHRQGAYNGLMLACERCDVGDSETWLGPTPIPRQAE